MRQGTAHIIQGNALALPLPDSSVDLVCTSPPYFGLRSYQDGGQHYEGQIGSEATPSEFLDALMAATREMVRVLKPSGSIFVNLGDKYASSGGHRDLGQNTQRAGRSNLHELRRPETNTTGLPNKTLIGIPWRYAIACIDQLGLILRAEIIWSKPNGLPESVQDRVRRSHEQWFHFTVQPRYFAAVDEIREAQAGNLVSRSAAAAVTMNSDSGSSHRAMRRDPEMFNPLGKLPGSVWTIPTQPLTVPEHLGVDHFAAYPMEWPRRIIQGWTPNGICTECGEGRRPSVDKTPEYHRGKGQTGLRRDLNRMNGGGGFFGKQEYRDIATIIGYTCNCPTPTAPTAPATVLDPFGGTGTTALVAKALGRTGISIDLSNDYCRLAEWRCNDPRELAAALQIEKPEPVPDAQLDLFT